LLPLGSTTLLATARGAPPGLTLLPSTSNKEGRPLGIYNVNLPSLEILEILLNNSCPVIFYCYVEAAVIYAFQCDFYRIETHDW
jgi:hypothetical protein